MNVEGNPKKDGVARPKDWVLFTLRAVSFLATAVATIVMSLNKQTKTLVVATIGSTPITADITAKFQHNPAFVFFVVANAMASFHNLFIIVVDLLRHKFNDKGLCVIIFPILDVLILALASVADGGAAFMSELGKNGNSHARWNKICDKFGSYCDRGGGALIASFIGLALLLVISVLSIYKLRSIPTPKPINTSDAVANP